jgi:hypothetical protein
VACTAVVELDLRLSAHDTQLRTHTVGLNIGIRAPGVGSNCYGKFGSRDGLPLPVRHSISKSSANVSIVGGVHWFMLQLYVRPAGWRVAFFRHSRYWHYACCVDRDQTRRRQVQYRAQMFRPYRGLNSSKERIDLHSID